MRFISLNNAAIGFAKLRKLIQRSYNSGNVLPTTCRVELINKTDFIKIPLNKKF